MADPPLTSVLPFGENATAETDLLFPTKVDNADPVVGSHKRTGPSISLFNFTAHTAHKSDTGHWCKRDK